MTPLALAMLAPEVVEVGWSRMDLVPGNPMGGHGRVEWALVDEGAAAGIRAGLAITGVGENSTLTRRSGDVLVHTGGRLRPLPTLGYVLDDGRVQAGAYLQTGPQYVWGKAVVTIPEIALDDEVRYHEWRWDLHFNPVLRVRIYKGVGLHGYVSSALLQRLQSTEVGLGIGWTR